MNKKYGKKFFICLLLIIIVVALIPLAFAGGKADTYQGYTGYLEDKKSQGEGREIVVLANRLKGGETVSKGEAKGYSRSVKKIVKGETVTFTVKVEKNGNYHINFDYLDLTNGYNKSDIAVQVRGKYQSEEFQRVPLEVLWKGETEKFDTDRYGNEIAPQQSNAGQWMNIYAWDANHRRSSPLYIKLKAGNNQISVTLNSGQILLGNIRLHEDKKIPNYEEYISEYEGNEVEADTLVIEAEKPKYKNNVSILSESDSDMNAYPYDTKKKLLNVISGSSFAEAGDTVYYQIDTKEEGLYKIALKYKQDGSENTTVFRTIRIDNEIPFQELKHYGFPYTDEFVTEELKGDDGAFLIYLEKGTHILSLTADVSPYEQILDELENMNLEMNSYYLTMNKLVGNDTDVNRDWTITDYFPEIQNDFIQKSKKLDEIEKEIKTINRSDSGTNAIASIQTASRVLKALAEEPDKIPNKLGQLTKDSGSVGTSIYDAVNYLQSQPLTLDRIYVTDSKTEIDDEKAGFFARLWNGVKQLANSFATDYSKKAKDDKTITVWVNRASILVNQMQKMADSEFTKETGIKVNFVQITDESKITLSALAGKTPDAVLGLSYHLPFELGTRTIACDLTRFDGYQDVMKRFAPGSMISLAADESLYALPETQNAYVLYYRKDIMKQLNLPVPQTWDEVIEILPELQRNGMNFYIPTSDTSGTKGLATTAPFIYQYGGSLYKDNGMEAGFDSEEAIKGLRMLTDLYTVYGLPYQVANFYNSFKDGTMPIGVASFDTYVTLSSAAPELKNSWDIALSPGVRNENGEIERWQSGGATSCMIFNESKHKDESWELLKWWTSKEVQTEFAVAIKSLYGDSYIWNTSNLEAFANVPMDSSHKETILKQYEWMMEYPRIPGAYMTEREISNIWNNVVFHSQNLRDQIDKATDNVGNELIRKLTEFGYMKDNKTVRQFKVNTVDDILKMMEE